MEFKANDGKKSDVKPIKCLLIKRTSSQIFFLDLFNWALMRFTII